jgi:hypothetical protein
LHRHLLDCTDIYFITGLKVQKNFSF